MQEPRDERLWRIAKKRVGFKKHLMSYIGVNLFLWGLWYFTQGRHQEELFSGHLPWPAWCTLGWGIGIFFNFADAYLVNKDNAVEDEYERLKRKR